MGQIRTRLTRHAPAPRMATNASSGPAAGYDVCGSLSASGEETLTAKGEQGLCHPGRHPGGMLTSIYTINGLRESDRNGKSLWGERQGEGVTERVEGHQQAVMATGEVCLVSPGYPSTERRVTRGPPQPRIASCVDRQQAADV